jgi:demethylmenaquinone methyltransferase/2-methoxy-6-polyprenyl-1,4-benzoquinol methylase
MFNEVAPKYDAANSWLSMQIHHLWRQQVIKYTQVNRGDHVLDCATGTGDLAIEFKKVVGPEGRVLGTDFCEGMLAYAPRKAQDKGLDIDFQVADVTALPYLNHQFDIASISFGIRNVENPVLALSEMARVTKPGGRVAVLEFGQVTAPIFGSLYNLYSRHILPLLGGWITGKPEAYRYLQESASRFPCREEFVQLMESTGRLENVRFWSLTGGIAYIYIGRVRSFDN